MSRTESFTFPGSTRDRFSNVLAALNAPPKRHALMSLRVAQEKLLAVHTYADRIKGTLMAGTAEEAVLFYYAQSLCPAGLVDLLVSDDFEFPTERTEKLPVAEIEAILPRTEGREFGIPVAALMLLFEAENGLCLYPILGQTSNHPTAQQPALTRAEIILNLRQQPELTSNDTDITNALELPMRTVAQNVTELATRGIITYESLAPITSKHYAFELVSPTTEIIPTPETSYEMGYLVIDTINELAQKGITEIGVDTIFEFFSDTTSPKEQHNFEVQIRRVLRILTEQHFLTKKLKTEGAKFSKATLTPLGLQIADQVLEPILSAMDGGRGLERLRAAAVTTVRDNFDTIVAQTTDLYYPYSRGFQRKESQNRINGIINYLREHPQQKFMARDISNLLEINISTARSALKSAASQDPHISIEDRGQVLYYQYQA